jgi:fibro-slime domain-containing protein
LALFTFSCGGGGAGGEVGPDGGTEVDAPPPPPDPDAKEPLCGDGILDPGEVCDDGTSGGGDGCAADCMSVEPGFACGDPATPCVPTHVCGNGLVEDLETCDDRNTTGNDGCSAACAIESGWRCDVPGIRCSAAACGDGIIAGFEECDDGGAATPGCSDTCVLEDGYQCPSQGMACEATVCGNGVREGTEQCDDGSAAGPDNNLGDGCTPLCTREPVCVDGTCTSVCGDGAIQAGEACDDGNLHDYDGCSATCTVEYGFTCDPTTDLEPMVLNVPVVYRDFKGNDLTGGHVDFENKNDGLQTGMVTSTLVNNKPQLINNTDWGSPHSSIKNRTTFGQWYTDNALAKTVVSTLPMTRTAPGTYVFSNNTFFPLDGIGWQDASVPAGQREISRSGHNFSFTSELRYWFKWQGNEQLQFIGDDDVWVFVNGKLAVDLGGVHGAQTGDITLDAATNTSKGLGMTAGGTYEVVVFQAERHTGASNYKLTLKGFNTQRSNCYDTCGDGEASSYEACDLGPDNGDGYNGCTTTCELGPRCGDGIVQTAEEQCDDGTALNTGAYGKCKPNCQLGPRCGDGVVQSANGETCDDGNTVSGDSCPADCKSIIL